MTTKKLWGNKNCTKRGLKSQQQNDNKSSILFRKEKFLVFQEKYMQKPGIMEPFLFRERYTQNTDITKISNMPRKAYSES